MCLMLSTGTDFRLLKNWVSW